MYMHIHLYIYIYIYIHIHKRPQTEHMQRCQHVRKLVPMLTHAYLFVCVQCVRLEYIHICTCLDMLLCTWMPTTHAVL